MTNKEAIKRIQDIITYNGLTIPTSLSDIEALEMAIKALQEQDRKKFVGAVYRIKENKE